MSKLDPDGSLRADGTYVIGSQQPWSWWIKDLTPPIRQHFRATAELAGALLSPGSGDPLIVWLEALRTEPVNFSITHKTTETNENGTVRRTLLATISRLLEASANFCLQQQARSALVAAIEPSPTLATTAQQCGNLGGDAIVARSSIRKSFVQPILDERGWSIEDWAKESKVDFHTANDYLKGITEPYPSTRKKLAVSLGVRELPK
jgi:hypothetical protein